MSTQTQARKLSIQTQEKSQRFHCHHGHNLVNFQCQTNGHNIKGFNVNTDTSSYTINAIPMGTMFCLKKLQIPLSPIVKAEYIPTDMYLEIYVTG